jgi:long-chain acyl-CoA synthetase
MSQLFEAIESNARSRGNSIAIQGHALQISYGNLSRQVRSLAERMAIAGPKTVGILADNSLDWILADLAATLLGVPVVPLPTFFSSLQIQRAIEQAGVDLLLTDRTIDTLPDVSAELVSGGRVGDEIACYCIERQDRAASPLPAGTRKVTFTSGSTGMPKGVCLSLESMEQVAVSLLRASAARTDDRHLCVLPLATLLENIAGVYVSLMAGATCVVPSLSDVGLHGSSGFDVIAQLSTLEQLQATSAILVPQMLVEQVAAIETGVRRARRLRHLAVGGGSVSPRLLERARSVELPVFQGYGLSECASVVALNTVDHNKPGSVGKPLPHLRLTIADDGEVVVHGADFLGYIGDVHSAKHLPLGTGDLGAFDEEGYLHVVGRKKNVFITSFGRNVSPEWVEREFVATSCVLQMAVFGEARPYNIAIVVPRAGVSSAAIAETMASVNSTLPDYAQVKHWIVACHAFTLANGQLSHNGRPRRADIHAAYASELDEIWRSDRAEGRCANNRAQAGNHPDRSW